MMPREHGRRLAELLPEGRLLEIEDSCTLIAEDLARRAHRGTARLRRGALRRRILIDWWRARAGSPFISGRNRLQHSLLA